MPRSRTLLPLLVALPALLVAGLGLLHPVLLTPELMRRTDLLESASSCHLVLIVVLERHPDRGPDEPDDQYEPLLWQARPGALRPAT